MMCFYKNVTILQNSWEKLAMKPKVAVPALIKTLKDRNWNVRNNSAQTLGKIGPAAKAAISGLIKILKYKKYD